MHRQPTEGVAILRNVMEFYQNCYSFQHEMPAPHYNHTNQKKGKEDLSMIAQNKVVKDQDYKNQPALNEEVREEETPKMFFIGNLLGCIDSKKYNQKEDEDNE